MKIGNCDTLYEDIGSFGIYVKTQEDYDNLMILLEKDGYEWIDKLKPTEFNLWRIEEDHTVIQISKGKKINWSDFYYCVETSRAIIPARYFLENAEDW